MYKKTTVISTCLTGAMVLLLSLGVQASHPRGSVIGGGYAAFDVDGAPGDNLYWVFARGGPGRSERGRWYADVFIDFGGFQFDFEALYTVDCLLIDGETGEAWVEGTIIESNDDANLGNRAFLYVLDGGPGGQDFHAITPLADDVTCDDRPEPDFMEATQSGDYRIRTR